MKLLSSSSCYESSTERSILNPTRNYSTERSTSSTNNNNTTNISQYDTFDVYTNDLNNDNNDNPPPLIMMTSPFHVETIKNHSYHHYHHDRIPSSSSWWSWMLRMTQWQWIPSSYRQNDNDSHIIRRSTTKLTTTHKWHDLPKKHQNIYRWRSVLTSFRQVCDNDSDDGGLVRYYKRLLLLLLLLLFTTLVLQKVTLGVRVDRSYYPNNNRGWGWKNIINNNHHHHSHDIHNDDDHHHPSLVEEEWRWDHNAYFHQCTTTVDTPTTSTSTNHPKSSSSHHHPIWNDVIEDDDHNEDVVVVDTNNQNDDDDDDPANTMMTTTTTDRVLLMAQIVGYHPHHHDHDHRIHVDESTKDHHERRRKTTRNKRQNRHQEQEEETEFVTDLDEITSRPNRAYARQWNRNYVRIPLRRPPLSSSLHSDNPPTNYNYDIAYTMSHFVKVIRDEQLQRRRDAILTMEQRKDNVTLSESVLLPKYDVIAILLPGSIILDLDYDLLQLIPTPTLISMSGGSGSTNHSNNTSTNHTSIDDDEDDDIPNGILFINLQHIHANTFIDVWWNMMQEPPASRIMSTTTDGDPFLLWPMMQSILMEMHLTHNSNISTTTSNNDIDDDTLILQLEEAKGGFVMEISTNPRHGTRVPKNDITFNDTNDDDDDTDDDDDDTGDETDSLDTSGYHNNYAYCLKRFSWKSSFLSTTTTAAGVSTGTSWSMDPSVLMTTTSTLQTMADAVCYRFYPKCEIL